MGFSYYFELLINGICQGSIYALIAIGYTLIAGIIGMVSFTHGEVIMIGAFASFYFATMASSNLILCAVVCFLISGILGIVIHKVCYEHFFNAPKHISLICTVGMSLLLKNLAQIYFGTSSKAMPQLIPSGYISIGSGDARITYTQLVIFSVVIVLCILLSLFLNKTRIGVSLRAVSQDKKASALVGINVGRTTMLGTIIGCGIGGISGMLYSIYYGSLSATMGNGITFKAFCSAVLAGMVDIPTSAGGGLIIGIFENYCIPIFGASMRDIIAFVFLIIVLLIKPEGIRLHIGKKKG